MVVKPAKYSSSLLQQVSSFKKLGYVLIKRPPTQDALVLSQLNSEILQYHESIKKTFKYRFWRYFNYVSTAENRHSIPLPLSFMQRDSSVVDSTMRHIFPLLNSLLCSHSPLVEFSTIISLPGAEKQEVHSDIPFSRNSFIVSVFVALAPVRMENGPTCIFSGSHTAESHEANARKTTRFYNSDGSEDVPPDWDRDWEAATGHGDDYHSLPLDQKYPEIGAMMEPGDILLFNTQVLHCGGANTSQKPRALLSFSFQNVNADNDNLHFDFTSVPNEPESRIRDVTASYDMLPEFTYHCDQSVLKENICLNSFSPASR